MSLLLFPALLPLVLAGPPQQRPAAAAPKRPPPRVRRDPEAERWLGRALKAIGGRERFEKSAALRFTFEIRRGIVTVSTRRTTLDLHGGRVRFDMDTHRGHLSVLVDPVRNRGIALENDEPVPEEDREAVVERALSYAMSDVVWVTLPFRAARADVPLALGDDLEREGRVYKRLRIDLDGDLFWLHVAADDAAITGFEWRPRALKASQAPLEFTSEQWQEAGGVRFATLHAQVGGVQRILVHDIALLPRVPEEAFGPLEEAEGGKEKGGSER